MLVSIETASQQDNNSVDKNEQPYANNTAPVRLMNELGESIPTTASHERRKSDSESVHSDKQVAEWIEDQQRPRNLYNDAQANSLRSKSESNIASRPKSAPPPVAPKPKTPKFKEVILSRNANEGFGFVIMSSPSSNGSVIGIFSNSN